MDLFCAKGTMRGKVLLGAYARSMETVFLKELLVCSRLNHGAKQRGPSSYGIYKGCKISSYSECRHLPRALYLIINSLIIHPDLHPAPAQQLLGREIVHKEKQGVKDIQMHKKQMFVETGSIYQIPS